MPAGVFRQEGPGNETVCVFISIEYEVSYQEFAHASTTFVESELKRPGI